MMSACVSWVKKQVDEFNVILLRQLSSVDSSSRTWQDCMSRAQTHAEMLLEVGMNFGSSIGIEASAADP